MPSATFSITVLLSVSYSITELLVAITPSKFLLLRVGIQP
jgi:hypothetical protein